MAKLTLTRFPDPRDEYQREQQAELIRQLEEMIQQLNTQYTQDTPDRDWETLLKLILPLSFAVRLYIKSLCA